MVRLIIKSSVGYNTLTDSLVTRFDKLTHVSPPLLTVGLGAKV